MQEGSEARILEIRRVQRHRTAAGGNIRKPEGDLHHCQSGDERRQIQLDDRNRVDESGCAADRESHQQCRHDKRETVQARCVRKKRHDHAAKRDQRTDRQIDAGRNDDERFSDAHDAVVRNLPQDLDDVAGLEKRTVRSGVDRYGDGDQQHDSQKHPQPVRPRFFFSAFGGSAGHLGVDFGVHYAAAPVAAAMTASGVACARVNSRTTRP